MIIENRNKQMCLQLVSSVEIMQIEELKNDLIFIYLQFSVSLMIKLVSCVVHVLQYCRYDIHFFFLIIVIHKPDLHPLEESQISPIFPSTLEQVPLKPPGTWTAR